MFDIRFATLQDADLVARFIRDLKTDLSGTPVGPDLLRAAILDGLSGATYRGLLAFEAGRAVGYAGMDRRFALYAPGYFLQLTELQVARDRRGSGIGAALLAYVEDIARMEGAVQIEVNLPDEKLASWPALVRFYARSGFETIRPRSVKILCKS